MLKPHKNIKVLDCQATDNEYLHKDFHGALCYAVKYLDDNYGPEATEDYLKQVGRNNYTPLIARMKKEGLSALEKHWRNIFTKEGGRFSIDYEDETLVLTVEQCPAITHLKKIKQLFTDRYCQTTVSVNKAICAEASYCCSCKYEPGKGKCVQRFWKPTEK